MPLSGLRYLKTVDQLLVNQSVNVAFESNRYKIKNNKGEVVYRASEEYNCCAQCSGSRRPFQITISDTSGNQVFQLFRTVSCEGRYFPNALSQNILQVYIPPGNLIGTVEQKFSLFTPKFDVKNGNGNVILKIEGPPSIGGCPLSNAGFGNVDFKIFSLEKSVIGMISKQWTGLLQEVFTKADNFGVSFPLELDVQMKAVLVGACFLIDFMYYE